MAAVNRLHKPHGKNRFCGPTVLSALTGLSTDDVAAVVRDVGGKGAVKGMSDWELIMALSRLGGRANHVAVNVAKKTTLQQWMEQRSDSLREKILVVTAGMHYMLVRKDLVLCSWTRGEWVNILSHPFRRKHFMSAILVTPPAIKAKLPPGVSAKRVEQARARSRASRDRRTALALAAKLHLDIERDGDLWITSMARSGYEFWRELLSKNDGPLLPDASLNDVDSEFYDSVLAGDSYGRDWSEVLSVVERVADFIKDKTGIDPAGRPGIIG